MACSVSVLLRGHPEDESPGASPSPGARWGFSLRSTPENSAALFDGEVGKTAPCCLAYYVRDPCKARRHVTPAESKDLQKGTRVCWQGDAADRGIITKTSWDAVTITWDNGHVAIVHHGDMREIERAK
jgi:hypothetical protein